jgi:competence protein ComEC
MILCAVLLLAAGISFFFSVPAALRVRLLACGAILGLLWSYAYEQMRIKPLRAFVGEAVQIRAVLSEKPTQTDYGCRVIAQMGAGKILLYLDAPPAQLSIGDVVTLSAQVRATDDNAVASNLYYQSRGISLIGFQKGQLQVERATAPSVWTAPKRALHALQEGITAIFPEDTMPFAYALLTGDTENISYTLGEQMSVTGISHVVAVSGMHVSLLVGVIMLLCGAKRRLGALISIPVMLFFAAMVGFSPSVTRALVMQSVLLLAPLLRRENDSYTSLSFALFLILIGNPWAIGSLSLQLSFAAVAGILLLSPKLRLWMLDISWVSALCRKSRIAGKPLRAATAILATTFGALTFTAPLLAYYFGLVSVVAPLTNLLALGAVSLCFPLTGLAALAGFVWLPLGKGIAAAVSILIRYVLWVIDWTSALPYAAVYTQNPYILAWLVTLYLLIAAFLLQRKRREHKPQLLTQRKPRGRGATPLICCIVLCFLCANLFSAFAGGSSVTMLDVRQGQCIYIRSGGTNVMVDCGGDRASEDGETAARFLLSQGVERLDTLILTHYDTDHVGGLAQLLSRIRVGALLAPNITDDSGNRAWVEEAAKQSGTPLYFIEADTAVSFDGGTISLFAPRGMQQDNNGLAVLLSFGDYDMLITGDMGATAERRLLDTHALADVEVLVAGHHGSKYSTCEELLEALLPEIVLISVGENSYGHPTQEVLTRVEAVGATVYRTDLCGDITITR